MILFTKHLSERIKDRNISKKEIVALLNERWIDKGRDKFGNAVIQKKINEKLIRVINRKENGDIILITAYRTSKIKNYG